MPFHLRNNDDKESQLFQLFKVQSYFPWTFLYSSQPLSFLFDFANVFLPNGME